jgi:4,5-dihydroxyphthalate decarboxylase
MAAQQITYSDLHETAALKTMLPWLMAQVEETKRELGDDWWSYGVDKNKHVLETFLRYHHEQGLSPSKLEVADLFAPEALESFKI